MTANNSQHLAHHNESEDSKVIFGFWGFILSNCIMFSALFISYVVLHKNTFGSIGIQQVASLPYVLVESIFLLACSFTFGFCTIATKIGKKCMAKFWLFITFALAIVFAAMSYHQFDHLITNGYSWHNSAFLSAYFGLVGIHWISVLFSLLWMVIVFIQILLQGLTKTMRTRVACLGLYINFLNIMWIFIFTLVYLMGAI